MNRALIIGNDGYESCPLRGCINDAYEFGERLDDLGVVSDEEQIVIADATLDQMVSGLSSIVADSAPGDTAVIFYSGHGSYVRDTNGDEPDRRDECLVPIDYETAGMLIDDEIQIRIQELKPDVHLEIFMDSCFSGSVTRAVVEGVNIRPAPRFLIPRNPVKALYGKVKPVFKQTITVKNSNHVLWSACKPNQVSNEVEFNGVPRGAFTYAFLDALEKLGPGAARNVLVRNTMREIKNMGLIQTPVLECKKAEIIKAVFV
jgi:hypothetical protein